MLFSSIEFIFFFMPVFLIIYYLMPSKYRNITLLGGSLIFYGYGESRWFVLIIMSLLIHYGLIRYSENKNRKVQTFCLVCMLLYGFGMLFLFKYAGFFQENWEMLGEYLKSKQYIKQWPAIQLPAFTLPLGISFYTFQMAAYVIDVYRKKIEPEKNIISLGAYICMFPQLIAGPIVLYTDVKKQIKNRSFSAAHLENGLKTFIIGLSLKMLLANTFDSLWHQIQTAGISAVSVPMVWLGALGYTFQIYFDFQGYSLMAMGLGEMLGFRIPRNFRHPYMACSITDFWRRWHITLSSWFKNYVYIPLGGSKKGTALMVRNMMIVWLLTGLWHGASWNFIIWGAYYFVLLLLEKLFLGRWIEKWKWLGWLYTFTAVITGWVIFAIDDLTLLLQYLTRMYGCFGDAQLWTLNEVLLVQMVKQYGLFFILAFIFSMDKPFALYKTHKQKPVTIAILFILFIVCIYQLNTAASNPFLYFRF